MPARIIALLLGLFMVLGTSQVLAQDAATKKPVVIGIALDGKSGQWDELRVLIEKEIQKLAGREFKISFPENKRLVGDYTVGTTKKIVSQLMDDPEVTMVLALGVLTSNDVVGRRNLPKPAVAPFVLSARLQGLEKREGGQVRRKNLSYLIWSPDFERDLRAFTELGEFKRIAFIASGSTMKAMPALKRGVEAEGKRLGLDLKIVPMGTDAKSALDQIPADVDAVYVGPNPQVELAEIDKLAAAFIERRLPSFSWSGRDQVERGILAGLGSPDDSVRLTRRVALNVQSILLGEDTSRLVTAFRQHEQLVLNMATARAIGVWPNWSIINDAVLINQKRKNIRRKLTLTLAVREAMRSNLDLAIARQKVRAQAHRIGQARANLLPQVGVSVTGALIDSDRGSTQQAERQLQWQAELNQSLYSQAALANLKIEKTLHRTREEERESIRLDIALQVAVSYLNLLKAQTFERVRRENLSLTRSNLSLARVRRRIGSAGPGEVFRWEAEIANARRDVILAVSDRNQAEIALNQLLSRPQEEAFVTKEASLDDPVLLSSQSRFRDYLSNPKKFRVLREFMAQEALRNAPELRRINGAMSAQKRLAKSTKRSLYTPSIGASASTTHRFLRGGAGAGPPPAIPGFAAPNEFDWFVGLSATLPLYEGGARYASLNQAEKEYQQLRLEKKLAAQQIEQRVRVALHRAGATFPAIKLTQDAADAARGNLRVVTDGYSRGVENIINLLDAQNQALVTDLNAASAVFDFLLDLMEVERAIGKFDFFRDSAQTEAFFSRLGAFSKGRAARP